MFFGVDYGSKLAGTTVVCFESEGQLHLLRSAKKQDADQFLQKLIDLHQPSKIFIDAPLSLPGAYFGTGEDYFYRECDKLTKAMSPMFLGGLTARAIKLSAGNKNVRFFETYPAALANELGLPTSKKSGDFEQIREISPFPIHHEIETGHHYDAVLAWLSGFRFDKEECLIVGKEKEGVIYI